jgi:thermitase
MALKAGNNAEAAASVPGAIGAAEELGWDTGDAGPPGPGVRNTDWEAFRNAGWAFVRAQDSFDPEVAGPSDDGVPGAGAKVYGDANRRLMLGGGHLSVRLREHLSDEQVREVLGRARVEIVQALGFAPNLFEVRVAPGSDLLDTAAKLEREDDVVYAEPEFIEFIPLRFKPTDPRYPEQWHLNNTGQDGGTPGGDLDVERAWDTTRGARTRIAVLDSGFDVEHPDLKAAFTPSSALFDLQDGSSATFRKGPAQLHNAFHGTRCAGIAVARANNDEGGCGVANEAELMAIDLLGGSLGNQLALARAVAYAADPRTVDTDAVAEDGADVISCSLGPDPWMLKQVLEDALVFATSKGRGGKGTPIFWATTNEDVAVSRDEVCSHQLTIAVGRSTNRDEDGKAASGPELDFVATGVDVLTTNAGGGYDTFRGTSLAAPAAAGVAALMLAVNPDLYWHEVRNIMRATCEKVGKVTYVQGRHDDFGFGRVNAAEAVRAAARAGNHSRRSRRAATT